jgi:hypothetical protein
VFSGAPSARSEATEDGVEHPLPCSEQGGSLEKEERRLLCLFVPIHDWPVSHSLRCVEQSYGIEQLCRGQLTA